MRKIYPLVLVASAFGLGFGSAIADDTLPHHKLPPSQSGDLVVGLCDGETSMEVPGVKPGQSMSRAQAQNIADTLMAKWRVKHPGNDWQQIAQVEAPQAAPRQTGESPIVTENGSPNPMAQGGPGLSSKAQTQTYGAFTARDRQIWKASTDALIAEGKRIFHDSKALGGTDAISCDMCHPDASNTHPETYPKFQVQLGRVAMLRDMINWCIENPVRGKPFADDDPRMKALEAYIISQRKGVPLNYGEH